MIIIMAPPYSTSSAATLRIPSRRFATQVVFSALAVLIPSLLQKCNVLPLSGLIGLVCGGYSDLALTYRNPRAKQRSAPYCIFLSTCLEYLHQATTALRERILDPSPGFSQTQHVAVHFCLALFIISEFEFYRAYIDFKGFESRLDAIKYFVKANVEADHIFPVSRDPWVFGYMNRTVGLDFKIFTKPHGLHIFQWLLFWIIGGLVNVLLKRIVNPSSNGWKDLLLAITSTHVFFTTECAWTLFVHLALLRVVRQANHVGFWFMVGVVEWWKARAEAQNEATLCADKQVV